MVFHRIVHRSTDHGLPRALRAVAVSLVLVVIAYGIARPPEQDAASSATNVAVAANVTSRFGSDRDSVYPRLPVLPSRLGAFEAPTARVDAPRECEAGVTDDCIFN